MSIIKNIEQDILTKIKEKNIPLDELSLIPSSRKDLGDYQINDAMKLAKVMHKNPKEIALMLKEILEETNYFETVEIAGVGFINLTFKDKVLIDAVNNFNKEKEVVEKKKIFIDYGGANIAKTLHVGHLRSANIGEALKRLARYLGHEVISDVHFGDIGRQSGMVIYEIKKRYPDLNYFKSEEPEEWDELPITASSLEEIYPIASIKAKEDEEVMEEVRQITKALEEGNKGYVALWNKIKEISINDIKNIYKRLNTSFDLWEGESNAYPYMPKMLERLESEGYLKESEGAKVIEVKEESDTAPMPPLVVVQNSGATLYATRELACLVSRMERFNPDEIWYLTDLRQELYFKQVFRAAYKTKIVKEDTKLKFFGFGTMNGKDGKPFKTRDGNAATLKSLLDSVKEEVLNRMVREFTEEEKEDIAEKITIAAVKYADLLPNRITDYIFDPSKFVDVEGKTGPYLLYSTIRMNSILNKAKEEKITYDSYNFISSDVEKELILLLLRKNDILNKAYLSKELNVISEYLYEFNSKFSNFYEKNYILKEIDKRKQESWLYLTFLAYHTNIDLLNILGIEVPAKM